MRPTHLFLVAAFLLVGMTVLMSGPEQEPLDTAKAEVKVPTVSIEEVEADPDEFVYEVVANYRSYDELIAWLQANDQLAITFDNTTWDYRAKSILDLFTLQGRRHTVVSIYDCDYAIIFDDPGLSEALVVNWPVSLYNHNVQGDELSHPFLPIHPGCLTVVDTWWEGDEPAMVRSIPFELGGARINYFFQGHYGADWDEGFPE